MASSALPGKQPPRKQALWVAICIGIVAGMLGLALSAAPLYAAFCRITGFGGATQVATKAPSAILDRMIDIRFDANVPPATPLEFTVEDKTARLRIGETGLAFFTVKNISDRPVKAVASYNVTPHTTGLYFQKLQCFCFQDRVFAPGETAQLPVLYYIDPAIVENRGTRETNTITLSYTYFEKAE
ncbi:MAG: cytochrome c oxidase assembly protein [Hyphomonadaceae bacterium]|nr:cytochrome c oxidase assembly protein [Hyphomonadaceae bacterium]